MEFALSGGRFRRRGVDPWFAGGIARRLDPQVTQVADLARREIQVRKRVHGAADTQVNGRAVCLARHEPLGAEAAVLVGADIAEDPDPGVVVGGELSTCPPPGRLGVAVCPARPQPGP